MATMQESDGAAAPGAPRRALFASLAAAAVITFTSSGAAADDGEPLSAGSANRADAKGAAARRRARLHRKKCKHFHRCKKHRNHTCRRKHACKHRFHAAPAKKPTPVGPTPAEKALAQPLTQRFTYGHTAFPEALGIPTIAEQMKAAGGPRKWFDQQLTPAKVADPVGNAVDGWWPRLRNDNERIGADHLAEVEMSWVHEANLQRWVIARRIYSTRQVHEIMSEFWENHLHVGIGADGTFAHRADYTHTIRRHALGTFSELLYAAVTHPAMGLYLTNGNSTRHGPNENLGRELLEVHTVGQGNYTEEDVKNSARILTGWGVASWAPWTFGYNEANHWVGAVKVLDFRHANSSKDGRGATRAYTDHLAKHPATARRIARKLAMRFVNENPSDAYVQRIANAYRSSGTDIKKTLSFIVDSPEFAAALRTPLVRTPTDDVAASFRALGIRLAAPETDDSAANHLIYLARNLGQAPFAWPRPDGQPVQGAAWSSPARLLASFTLHWQLSHGSYPKNQATFRSVLEHFPGPTATASEFVTRLATATLGRAPEPGLVTACIKALALEPGTVLTREGDRIGTPSRGFLEGDLPGVVATVLDSPAHMHR